MYVGGRRVEEEMEDGVNLVIVSFWMRISPLACTLYSVFVSHTQLSYTPHSHANKDNKGHLDRIRRVSSVRRQRNNTKPPLELYSLTKQVVGMGHANTTGPDMDHTQQRSTNTRARVCVCVFFF